jgi:FHA domain
MGILEEKGVGRRFTLGARCLMGRHEACDLQLADARVSSEHASLHWMSDRWELRDLGSRNGTFVGPKRLTPGERVALAEGATLTLGGPARAFTLIDASAPRVSARHARTDRVRGGTEGFLALPDDDQPIASIFEDGRGDWVLEAEDAVRLIRDHEPVVVAGETWVLSLPLSNRATLAMSQTPILEDVTLRLAVSRDEEHVEAAVVHGDHATPLPPRSFHYLLLTLARARLGDLAESPGERGWVDRDEICRMLAIDALKLNTDICRLRKQLGELGVRGAPGIVERRPGSGQVRIGIDRLEIARL